MVMFEVPMCRTRPSADQLFHRRPGLHEILVDVGPGVGAAGLDVAAGRMEIRERPVDEIEVEIIEPQIGERSPAGIDDGLRGMHRSRASR